MLPIFGVIAATVLVIILSLKGFNILITAPVCAMLVMITNGISLTEGFFSASGSFMSGLSGFVQDFFIIFLLGSVLTKYMEESGAVNKIAGGILSITGTDKPYSVLVAIFLISAVLTYGGVSLFIVLFAVVPLARNLFQKLNLPWHLLVTPYFLGVASLTMTMLPGTPAIQNVIPSTALGTKLTAAPLAGIAASVVVVVWGLFCIRRELAEAEKRQEGFDPKYAGENAKPREKEPGLIRSLLPLAVLVFTIFAGSYLNISNIIVIGLGISVCVAACLFHTNIEFHKKVMNEGAMGALSPIIFSAAAVGFGTVIASAGGFQIILEKIQQIPGSPLLSLSILTGVMAGATGSSSGALGIVMNNFVQPYLDMGLDINGIHRMTAIASGVLCCLPQCGSLLSLYNLTGLSHKGTYKNLFISVIIGNFLAFSAAFAVIALQG